MGLGCQIPETAFDLGDSIFDDDESLKHIGEIDGVVDLRRSRAKC